ncbi:MAG: hypothetical protein ABSB41_17700 [Anaerolineales bacterium]
MELSLFATPYSMDFYYCNSWFFPLFEFWGVSYNGFVPAPILTTKLFIPPLRPKVVVRPLLIERLNEGLSLGCNLTLISAPAGFGKSERGKLAGIWKIRESL